MSKHKSEDYKISTVNYYLNNVIMDKNIIRKLNTYKLGIG